MKMSHMRIAFLALFLASIPPAVRCQDAPTPAQNRAVERVEEYKKIRLMEVLGLDEQSSIKFFARYNEHQQLLRDLRQKQIQTMQRIQGLRKSNAPDAEYGKVIDDLKSLEIETNDAKLKYIDRLKEVLNNKQIAEYLVFELRFQQNLRDLIRDAQLTKRQEQTKR